MTFTQLQRELKHPEWFRTFVHMVVLAVVMVVTTVSATLVVVNKASAAKNEVLAQVQEVRREVAQVKVAMIDRALFRRFLKTWDKANPTLPATPMFDDVINDAVYSLDSSNTQWLAWIAIKYGAL